MNGTFVTKTDFLTGVATKVKVMVFTAMDRLVKPRGGSRYVVLTCDSPNPQRSPLFTGEAALPVSIK